MKSESILFKEVNDKYFRGPSQELEDGTLLNIYSQEGIIDWLVTSQKKGEFPKGLRANKKISIRGKQEEGYEYRFELKDELGKKTKIKLILSAKNVYNWNLGKIINNRVQIFGKKILATSLILVMGTGMGLGTLYVFSEAAEQESLKSEALCDKINQARLEKGMRTIQEEQQIHYELVNKIKEEYPYVDISELDMQKVRDDYINTGQIHFSSKSK